MFMFLTFFFSVIHAFLFYEVCDKSENKNNNQWETWWSIFMNAYISGIRKKDSRIIILGTLSIILLIIAIVCFLLSPKYDNDSPFI